jgi:uncharacterized linocin/CFP29 family protein
MANKYLTREDAPFDAAVWDILDTAMTETARGQLTGRRLLPLEGPHGLGLKSIPLKDTRTDEELTVSQTLPVVYIEERFNLGMRDLANFEREGLNLDTQPIQDAALACAKREDALIFHGGAGVPGLLNTEDAHEMALSDWSEIGTAAEDIIQAVTILDDAGFHGPYTLALEPQLYNALLRRYPQGNQSELEHLRTMVTDGIVKAPAVDGGVLLASDKRHASIVMGQDMTIGFIGPAGDEVEFSISESLTVRVRHPQALVILTN